MEFHRAGGRPINHRLGGSELQTSDTRKDSNQRSAEGGGGGKKRFENNPRPFGPLRPLWQVVRSSTLPKMAAPLGYSCYRLLWESCRHRLTLPLPERSLHLNDTRGKRRVTWWRLRVASERERRFNQKTEISQVHLASAVTGCRTPAGQVYNHQSLVPLQ